MCALTAATIASAACSSGSSPSAARPGQTVSGRVGVFGGPLNPKTGHMAASNVPAAATGVRAVDGEHRVTRTVTDANGRFSLILTPGVYSVSASCGVAVRVVVGSARVSPVDLRCDVP